MLLTNGHIGNQEKKIKISSNLMIMKKYVINLWNTAKAVLPKNLRAIRTILRKKKKINQKLKCT